MTVPSDDHPAQTLPQPRLPPELLSRIILFTSLLTPHHDSTHTLHSLSLTSHDLHKLTTPYLYRDPLYTSISQQRAFWSTIAANPHLWWHVRNITLGQRDWRRDAKTTFRPRPRLVQLGESIASSTSTSTSTSASRATSRWAENFHLWAWASSQSLSGPRPPGPEPTLLREVAWWEEAPVGGLLSGHCYGTKPVGEWSKPVDLLRTEMQMRQQRARTVEDVDLGRGPGQSLGIPVREEDREDELEQRRTDANSSGSNSNSNPKSFQASSLQPTGMDDDDLWAAAERFASMTTAASTAATSSAPARSPSPSSSTPLPSVAQLTTTPSSWPPIPASLHPAPTRIPYRYTLITGYLDPNLPRFFHSIPSLQQIQLTLYPGTLLDHDLLEHQLRLLLDTDLMPILQRLDVIVAHDSTSLGTRLARITHSKVIELAVSRVDDPRCVLKFDDHTTYGGVGKDSREDVRRQVANTWTSAMHGHLDAHIDTHKVTPPKGKKWVNGWLQRDPHNLNRPIEE